MTTKRRSSFYQYFTIAILLVSLHIQFGTGLISEQDDDSVLSITNDVMNMNATITPKFVGPNDSFGVVIPPNGPLSTEAANVTWPNLPTNASMNPPSRPLSPYSTSNSTSIDPPPSPVETTPQPSTADSSPDPYTDKPSTLPESPPPVPPSSAAPVTASIVRGATSVSNLDLSPVSITLKCIEGQVTPATPGLSSDFCTKLMKYEDQVDYEYDERTFPWELVRKVSIIGVVLLFIGNGGTWLFCCFGNKLRRKKKDGVDQKKALNNTPPLSLPFQLEDQRFGRNPLVEEVKSPPSIKINHKLKDQLLETQMNLARLRAHVRKNTREHRSDTRSSKFVKKGPIFIPKDPDIPPGATHLPNNVILENVIYDPSGNEMYEIGSDVDDIELEPSTSSMMGSTTSVEDEATKKDLLKRTPSKNTPSKSTPKPKDEGK